MCAALRSHNQVLRHQQRQHPLLHHVACVYICRLFAVWPENPNPNPFLQSAPHAKLRITFSNHNASFPAPFSYQFPPSPDSKIVSLSCPSDNPGCQKTPYILRMTFASSLFFFAMFVAPLVRSFSLRSATPNPFTLCLAGHSSPSAPT